MTMYRTTAIWSGFTGSPGYTNFYFQGDASGEQSSAQACLDKARAFFTGIAGSLPQAVKIDMQPEVARMDEATGMVETFLNVTPGASITGTQTGSFSAPTGACVTWVTGGVRQGRRVRGRTFLVPLASNAMQSDGTLNTSDLTTIRAAATTLGSLPSPELLVWSRPSVKGAADGQAFHVLSARVMDKAAVLRSRRD